MVFRRARKCKGIILLRIPPKSAGYLEDVLVNLLKRDIQFENAFVVVSLNRIRVISLQNSAKSKPKK
jgi:hypothetical protein